MAEKGIKLMASAHAASHRPGLLELTPGPELEVDRVVALPRLVGRPIEGLPSDHDGFLATDVFGRVNGVDGIYAAGDITTFPVKQGGLATQQADAAAYSIVAAAGSSIEPVPFAPVLHGLLLTGSAASYMRSELAGGHGETAVVSGDALWWPPAKIAGRYLGPFLAERSGIELLPPPELDALRVELAL
jgi:sulfide:quinone oxidoreductase